MQKNNTEYHIRPAEKAGLLLCSPLVQIHNKQHNRQKKQYAIIATFCHTEALFVLLWYHSTIAISGRNTCIKEQQTEPHSRQIYNQAEHHSRAADRQSSNIYPIGK